MIEEGLSSGDRNVEGRDCLTSHTFAWLGRHD